MDKRGQFYILGAIIIVIVLYSLATKVNVIEEQQPLVNFKDIANNYIKESIQTINYALYTDSPDSSAEISSFTDDFISYIRARNPRTGLVYVYSEGDASSGKTIIKNHLPSGTVSYQTDAGSGALFNSAENSLNEISLRLGNEEFRHQVPVKLSSFSSDYYTASIGSAVDSIKIDIGGTPFFYTLSGPTDFEVILKTTEELTNLPSCEVTCSYAGGPVSCTTCP